MSYGHHIVATPAQRWCILIAYWSMLAVPLARYGYFKRFQEQPFMPLTWYHVASLFLAMLFLSAWTWGAYTFHRPLSLFATIVYPLGHGTDALAWYALYDFGKWMYCRCFVLSNNSKSQKVKKEKDGIIAYTFAYTFLSGCIFLHRVTFELWYLPEHHPPYDVRFNNGFVVFAILLCAVTTTIYETMNDLRWCVLLRMAMDVYCVIRLRMPSPWSQYGEEHNPNLGWDWTGW